MSKLTWLKETKTWLIDRQPSARRRGQRGFDPVRRKRRSPRISEREIFSEPDRQEKERLRQGWIAMGSTPARADYLVFLSTCPDAMFLKFIKHELKRRNGKCVVFGSHRWNGGNGFCTKCGAEKRTKGMGKKITRLARYLNIKRPLLCKMLNDNPQKVGRLVKRAVAERKWKEQRERILKELNAT